MHLFEKLWLQVEILGGRALKERQFTPEEEAQYVTVQDSVHWEGVYSVHERTLYTPLPPIQYGTGNKFGYK